MSKLNLIKEMEHLSINEDEYDDYESNKMGINVRENSHKLSVRGVVENQENSVEDLTAAFVNHYKDDPMGTFMHAKSSYLDAVSRAKNFSTKAAAIHRTHSSMSKQEFQDAVMKHFVPHLMKHGFPKHASAGWGEAEHDLMKSLTEGVKRGVAEGLEQNVPPVLYHATYKPRLKSIKLKGLGAGGKRNWEDSLRGVVYLALDPNVAESYAESSDMVPDEWLDQIVILKISTAGLDPNKFGIDSNVQDNSGDTVEYHGVIPVSNISLYTQGVAEGSIFASKQEKIRELKNLIAIATERGNMYRVQELELELKKLLDGFYDSDWEDKYIRVGGKWQPFMKRESVAEGLNEAKTKTKTKPDISDTFKQKPDQPLTKKDDKKAEKPKDEPKGETPKFKVSSKDETLKKTAGIRMNDRAAELLSKMKDVEADPDDPGYPKHETLPSTNVKPDNVPAVINKAMTVKGFLNPEWHIVANLPGNMATAIRTVGRKLFKSFTRTPTDKIVMIGNVMNHGPNTNPEINAVAKWLKNAGQEVSSGDIDFSDFMPGYKADIKMYDAAGCRFLLVEDFAGRYVYVWPHNDSVTMSNAPQLTKEDINIIKEAELRFRTLAGL